MAAEALAAGRRGIGGARVGGVRMGSDRIERMGPDLLRVIAPNPSAFTAEGTNTWILGTGEACVIDPGPMDERHLGAVMEALAGRSVGAIRVSILPPSRPRAAISSAV